MSCENVQTTEKHRVLCPTCSRYYSIQKYNHVCNPILPCDLRGSIRYAEIYIEGDMTWKGVPRAECNECEETISKKNRPQKNKCPSCGYVGFYVADEGKLCPVCRIVPPERPKKTIGAKTMTTCEPIGAASLPTIQLYPSLVCSATDPVNGQCLKIKIDGWYAPNVLSGIWCPEHWEFDFHDIRGLSDSESWGRLEESYKEGMKSLKELLIRLRLSYTIGWSFGVNMGARLWLWYLWTLYGDNEIELGYSP